MASGAEEDYCTCSTPSPMDMADAQECVTQDSVPHAVQQDGPPRQLPTAGARKRQRTRATVTEQAPPEHDGAEEDSPTAERTRRKPRGRGTRAPTATPSASAGRSKAAAKRRGSATREEEQGKAPVQKAARGRRRQASMPQSLGSATSTSVARAAKDGSEKEAASIGSSDAASVAGSEGGSKDDGKEARPGPTNGYNLFTQEVWKYAGQPMAAILKKEAAAYVDAAQRIIASLQQQSDLPATAWQLDREPGASVLAAERERYAATLGATVAAWQPPAAEPAKERAACLKEWDAYLPRAVALLRKAATPEEGRAAVQDAVLNDARRVFIRTTRLMSRYWASVSPAGKQEWGAVAQCMRDMNLERLARGESIVKTLAPDMAERLRPYMAFPEAVETTAMAQDM